MAFSTPALRSRVLAGAVVASLAVTLSACGSDDTRSAEATSNDTPSSSTEGGTLRVGTDATYAPYEFKEGSDYVGIEPDLIEAVAEELGMTVQYIDVKYTVAEGALQAGRFDIEATGLTDTPERRAKFYMINHTVSPWGLIVPAGNPDNLSDLASICGKTIAIFDSPAARGPLKAANKEKCAGNAINILSLGDANGPYAALQSGRADAVFNQYVQGSVQAAKMNAEAVPVPDAETSNVGLAVDHSNLELAQKFTCAMQKVIDAGVFSDMAEKYSLDESVFVTEAQIDGGDTELTC